MKLRITRAAAIAIMAAALPLMGQTASELLQKAIYTQETLGDIPAAMKLYQQVLAMGSDARSQAAQAQYRLGLCYIRQNNPAEGKKAFDKLAADFPEQKELIQRAKEQTPSGAKLLPAPWSEGETHELAVKLAGGGQVGVWLFVIEKASGGTVVSQARMHLGAMNQVSRSEAEAETLKPIQSVWRHTALGESKLTYSEGKAKVELAGKETKTMDVAAQVFDNEMAIPLMRRLPFAAGYSEPINILGPLGQPIEVTFTVKAIEDVQTPAGQFKAFRVELSPIQQTFWISADRNRNIVKFDGPGVYAELVQVHRSMPGGAFKNDAIAFQAPSGWLARTVEGKNWIFLLDPEGKCNCGVWTGEVPADLQAEVEKKKVQRAKELKGYTVRVDSLQTKQVGGHNALSYIADYVQGDKKMIEYVTLLKAAKTGFVFVSNTETGAFDSLKPAIDKLTATVQTF